MNHRSLRATTTAELGVGSAATGLGADVVNFEEAEKSMNAARARPLAA